MLEGNLNITCVSLLQLAQNKDNEEINFLSLFDKARFKLKKI